MDRRRRYAWAEETEAASTSPARAAEEGVVGEDPVDVAMVPEASTVVPATRAAEANAGKNAGRSGERSASRNASRSARNANRSASRRGSNASRSGRSVGRIAEEVPANL